MATKIKQILVTGSAGFIGSYLVPELEEQGYDVAKFDLKNGWDLFDIVDLPRVAAVVHLAALKDVQESQKQPYAYYRTNVLGTAHIIRVCMDSKVPLIFASSAAVHEPNASVYAQSKAWGEVLVRDCLPNAVILRLFNVYGSGSNKNSVFGHFLSDDPIKVNGQGHQTRDFIHVKQVADIIAASLGPKWHGKTVEVGSGIGTPIDQLARAFADLRKVPIEYGPEVQEAGQSIADTRQLNHLYRHLIRPLCAEDIKRIVEERQNIS